MLIAVVVASVLVTGYALIAYSLFPAGATVHPDMRSTYATHSLGIYLHIFGSAVALGLGPWQFFPRLRSNRPALHRWLGRLYLGVGVLIGGVAGLYMAQFALGGGLARTGFTALALLWLLTGLMAYLSIRGGNIAAHRRWMLRNFALTFAAVTLRIYLPVPLAAGLPFEPAYAVIAWLCWLPNLLVVELWLRGHQKTPQKMPTQPHV